MLNWVGLSWVPNLELICQYLIILQMRPTNAEAKSICRMEFVIEFSGYWCPSILLKLGFWQVNDVVLEVGEGDARYVLCEAVDKHHAATLVVGSHGYGTVKRLELNNIAANDISIGNCGQIVMETIPCKLKITVLFPGDMIMGALTKISCSFVGPFWAVWVTTALTMLIAVWWLWRSPRPNTRIDVLPLSAYCVESTLWLL